MNNLNRQEKKLVIACAIITGIMFISLIRLMFA
jgi:hypothetical protein